jgi:hypothetical protein
MLKGTMPKALLNCPAPPPAIPVWQAVVQVSNWLIPSATPQP